MTKFQNSSRTFLVAVSLLVVVIAGVMDHLTQYEVPVSFFYLAAVATATWFTGWGFGMLVAILSVASWVAGAHVSNPWIPAWNAVVILSSYLIVVGLLASLRSLHGQMEERVQQRTAALREEIAERQRLEKEILAISEREQRRIGHDLHDSLCQHLTGTALAGQVLSEKLAARSLPEAADANHLVGLVEESITLARRLARGLDPVGPEAEGLMAGLQELAATAREQFKTDCRFECDVPVLVPEVATVVHLYRIAQEAVANAARHGQAKHIHIRLARSESGVTLAVVDDGVGLPEPLPAPRGMGLRIMAHRARIIGATFDVRRAAAGGTIITCTLP